MPKVQKVYHGMRTPDMRFQFLQQDVRRNFADDIGNEENRQGGIIFGSRGDVQVGLEIEQCCITDIDPLEPLELDRSRRRPGTYRSRKASR